MMGQQFAGRSCRIEVLVVAVERNADVVLGSTRNTLSQLLVLERGKAFLEQGLEARVTLQRKHRREELQLCSGNCSLGLNLWAEWGRDRGASSALRWSLGVPLWGAGCRTGQAFP